MHHEILVVQLVLDDVIDQVNIKATSVPGRIGSQTSAFAASGVKRGSMDTDLTPRARSSAKALPPPAEQL